MKPPSPCTGSMITRRDRLGADDGHQHALERLPALLDRRRFAQAHAVGVRERRAVDLGREWAEGLFERCLAGERERHQRAAVVAALEGDDRLAAGGGARDLDRILDALGAAVRQDRFARPVDRHGSVEALGQLDIWLIGADQRREVQQLGGLRLDGGDHLGRAVAGVEHADPADEIDQRIAIHIGHQRAAGAFDSDLMGFVQAVRHGRLAPCDQLARARARDWRANADAASDRRGHTASSTLAFHGAG